MHSLNGDLELPPRLSRFRMEGLENKMFFVKNKLEIFEVKTFQVNFC